MNNLTKINQPVMISIKDNCEVLVTYEGRLSDSVEELVMTLRNTMSTLKVVQQHYTKPDITIKSKKTIKLIKQLLAEDCTVLIEDRITNDFTTTNAILLKAKFNMYNTLYEIHSAGSTVKMQDNMSVKRLTLIALSLQKRVEKQASTMLLKAKAEATLLLIEGLDVVVYFKYSWAKPKPLTSIEDLSTIEDKAGNIVNMYGYNRAMDNYNVLPRATYRSNIYLTVETVDTNCSYHYEDGITSIVRHPLILKED